MLKQIIVPLSKQYTKTQFSIMPDHPSWYQWVRTLAKIGIQNPTRIDLGGDMYAGRNKTESSIQVTYDDSQRTDQ